MTSKHYFKISTHLKDVIGRDLVTNEFVAIFELVKNSVDAGADRIDIEVDPNNDMIRIVDNGKGMSSGDLVQKWLFVAYSAKADGSEDVSQSDYRNKIKVPSQYAGSKGIGRFACDTLGKKLRLYSNSTGKPTDAVSLEVNWEEFERDGTAEFDSIEVVINESANFPPLVKARAPTQTGTVIEIEGLRHSWGSENVKKLRSFLAKLVDPFGTTESSEISTYLIGSNYTDLKINGPIGNRISDLLRDKTARISVSVQQSKIVSELYDRGRRIYRISEPNTYQELDSCKVVGEIFYLNQSAKMTFAQRMKVASHQFGSIFVFLNGFRIFPIGEELDDTFGLNRRKAQGHNRFFGTREVLGRIDVTAPPKMFRESSSRDAGLIEDANSRALRSIIFEHMIKRLEKYVTTVNWPDPLDSENDTPERLLLEPAKARILQIVGGLARNKDIEVIDFDKDVVAILDEQRTNADRAYTDLKAIAKREGDDKLLQKIEQTRSKFIQLEKSEYKTRQHAAELALEISRSDDRIAKLEKQSKFLSASQNLDAERVQLLLHQVNIYSGHIAASTERGLAEAQRTLRRLEETDDIDADDLIDLAGSLRTSLRSLMGDFSYIRLENNRLQTISRFAPNIKVDLETSQIHGDIVEYLGEYFSILLSDRASPPKVHFESDIETLACEFSPFDLAVVIDNLIDNSRKAAAQNIWFRVEKSLEKGKLAIRVRDDGRGLDLGRIDRNRIFEKHYSGSNTGVGLGLYHVAEVLNAMGGSIDFDPLADKTRADFLITIPEKST